MYGTIAGQIDIENIEMELKHVTEWLKMNKLSLNVNKTKAMLFHMPQKEIIVPQIKINGTIIEFVDYLICLGINLNKHLNWNQHVRIVSDKLVKTDIATPKLWNLSVGPPSKTTKSDTKTSCKNIDRQ